MTQVGKIGKEIGGTVHQRKRRGLSSQNRKEVRNGGNCVGQKLQTKRTLTPGGKRGVTTMPMGNRKKKNAYRGRGSYIVWPGNARRR